MQELATHYDKTVAVIGGGPAGLMAAEILGRAGVKVHVYDAMPSVGRKFLMAGKGGLNITHSEPFADFLSRYVAGKDRLAPLIENFSPSHLREWVHDLGIMTFIGSSGRVFPEEMKAAPLLRTWLHRLKSMGVLFHVRHEWLGWDETGSHGLRFQTPEGIREIKADAVVLALGGGSWPQLGSTGKWTGLLSDKHVQIAPLAPSNCGFDVRWSDFFRERFAGHPLKSVSMDFGGWKLKGDCMVTDYGIEGGIVYALSAFIRTALIESGKATVWVDLKPDSLLDELIKAASKPRGKESIGNFLRKRFAIEGAKAALLREKLSLADFGDAEILGNALKAFPLDIVSPRPLAEAISSAGGVSFDEIDDNLMIKALPGIFCAGEMLDWDAPTGGYLITACLASGLAAGQGVVKWLQSESNLAG